MAYRTAIAILLMLVWVPFRAALALGPHEVALIVNESSTESIRVAKVYRSMRRIPEANVVRINVPLVEGRAAVAMRPGEFTRLIWNPVNRRLLDRQLNGQILAWVYSVDFPVRIRSTPALSIQGLTFLRNRRPEARDVRDGTYASPLFAGPLGRSQPGSLSQTFDRYREWLGRDMPLPSMMLGYIGPHGNSASEVLECLQRGLSADGTRPSGDIYFVRTADVRSRCRQWQFRQASLALRARDLSVKLVDEEPAWKRSVLGVMMGAPGVQPERNSYVAGCMAEHLTSAAAVFDSSNQTKLTAWIKAGATASAGTVTEPLSIWSKFPNAWFYVHYAAGCTMIESFYQSIRCPLQLLLVGEPLAAPWAPDGRLTLTGLGEGVLKGAAVIGAVAEPAAHYPELTFLLDGRIVQRGRELRLDTTSIEPGFHRLRVVARRTGLVSSQLFVEETIEVEEQD